MKKLKQADKAALGKTKKNLATESLGAPVDNVGHDDGRARTTVFKDHLLEGFPIDALPFADGNYKGKHSYTVYVGDAATWCHHLFQSSLSFCWFHSRLPCSCVASRKPEVRLWKCYASNVLSW